MEIYIPDAVNDVDTIELESIWENIWINVWLDIK